MPYSLLSTIFQLLSSPATRPVNQEKEKSKKYPRKEMTNMYVIRTLHSSRFHHCSSSLISLRAVVPFLVAKASFVSMRQFLTSSVSKAGQAVFHLDFFKVFHLLKQRKRYEGTLPPRISPKFSNRLRLKCSNFGKIVLEMLSPLIKLVMQSHFDIESDFKLFRLDNLWLTESSDIALMPPHISRSKALAVDTGVTEIQIKPVIPYGPKVTFGRILGPKVLP
ncbi:hypothetical protein F3Y22_tig00112370pilonHSYRG00004 [Hibiscus syriacus]|uniref:Uncharacterized protein n=1 Tax=Hibiscus syriacus TaxID=106335 RepID=A0A6A2X0K0_HIBSY|nr:hypothetical protein F3Y22_tig00112370pilonHSYRG00004 [Hibiscus syriacus]